MKTLYSRGQNYLLSELYAVEFDRLIPFLEPVLLTRGEILYQAEGEMAYAYFPTTSIVSIDSTLADGSTVELASIGNEGIVGLAIFMGGATSPNRAIVRVTGRCYRIGASHLLDEFYRKGPLLKLFLRYAQSMMAQLGQRVVCNGHHSAEQRLCTLILQMMDRTYAVEFAITHEELGHLLGVRRETVTEAASHLQELGMIKYRRGQLAVLDRAGILHRCCECYQIISDENARLQPRRQARATLAASSVALSYSA
ncbi:Crp/Fnr family transcriptional regulator [Massilia sp. DWR3-1-1]|uniref:Crp/Fnr family transcriptional regulator n=1 Tax=Massilia sp. DWR3-1-1 TaxID=2804559 RepID=UPI003CF18B0A